MALYPANKNHHCPLSWGRLIQSVLPLRCSEIDFNIKFPFMPMSYLWSLSVWLSTKTLYKLLPMRSTCPAQFILLDFVILNTFCEDYTLQRSSICILSWLSVTLCLLWPVLFLPHTLRLNCKSQIIRKLILHYSKNYLKPINTLVEQYSDILNNKTGSVSLRSSYN
jgi:hypothetical protein